MSNLRPITLLPTPAKLLEKIVHRQLRSYLELNSLLIPNQGGFRSGHSTITKLADLTDDLFAALDNKFFTALVFLDFKKAFDTVNHHILINKLGHFWNNTYLILK